MQQHLKTMERPFIIEIIDERFDNISTMLTDNAVVYGSSITSIISGLKAKGDLDIAVSHTEFMTLCKKFANSSKWKQVAGDKINETDFSLRGGSAYRPSPFRHSTPQVRWAKPTSSYKNVSKVVAFENIGDKRVQIIQANEKTDNPLSDALSIVRAVDFIFCGIAIDKHGKVFEVIKSALDDCNSKIIRVASYHSKLKERFNKYIKRGWSLGISIDQAQNNYLRKKTKERKISNDKYVKVDYNSKTGLFRFVFSNIMLKKITKKTLHNLVVSTSKTIYGISLKPIEEEKDIVYTEDGSKKGLKLTEKLANEISDEITRRFKMRYAPKKKKKFSTGGDYNKAVEIEEPTNMLRRGYPPKKKMSKSQQVTLDTEFEKAMAEPFKSSSIIVDPDDFADLLDEPIIPTERAVKKMADEMHTLGSYTREGGPYSRWDKDYITSVNKPMYEPDEAEDEVKPAKKKKKLFAFTKWDIGDIKRAETFYTKYSMGPHEEKNESMAKMAKRIFSKQHTEDKKVLKKGESTNE